MEKPISPCDKEYMRMTMITHEETFKQQVFELHRLYKVQKKLMKNMEASSGLIQNCHHKGSQITHKINIAELASEGVLDIISEAEIELTLGPSIYNCNKRVETKLTSDSGSSSSTREEISGDIIGLVQVPYSTSGSGYQSGITNSCDIEEQSRPDRSKQPPWLLQVLSLNTA